MSIFQDYPRYAYNYAVNDPHTKDSKAQWEERDGDKVQGAYSLLEPDGTLRIVEYSADDLTGFNAIVKRYGANLHPIESKHLEPIRTIPVAPVIETKALPIAPINVNPIVSSLTYGLGAPASAIGVPKYTVFDKANLPWDPLTLSYGGWVPINDITKGPHAYVFSKKYVNGHLHKWVTGPISLINQKLKIRTEKKH